MEFEQIAKRLDWLDEEHRKDKAALEALSDRLQRLETDLEIVSRQVKELEGQISRYSALPGRMDQYDAALNQQRKEIVAQIADLDKRLQERLTKLDAGYQKQIDALQVQKRYAELRKLLSEVKRDLQTHVSQSQDWDKILRDWEERLQLVGRNVEDVQRAQKTTEEARRLDSKRVVDLQGDISAARKRLDEVSDRDALLAEEIRRLQGRLNELLASEAERKQKQIEFIETQARLQVDRERTWRGWEEQLETLRQQTEMVDHNLQEWDAIQRAIKRAQETYEEIIQKFERRINEITEMQRLAEDRFRQEWVTFRADDQKRWTSYTLSQDEVHKETRTLLGKLEERLVALEDLAQTQQDIFQQTKDANEQLFQGMVAQIHELLSAYERITGTK